MEMFVHCNANNETQDDVDKYMICQQCKDTIVDPKVHEKQFFISTVNTTNIISIPVL